MKSIKGVIFDLDNTLLDFMKMKEFAVKAAVKGMIEAGLMVDEEDSYTEIVRIYEEFGWENQKVFDVFIEKQIGHVEHKYLAAGIVAYRRAREANLMAYPNVNKTLMALAKSGIKLGVVSDAPSREAWMRIYYLNLYHFFDVVITFDDSGERKPSEKPFKLCLDALDLDPDETIMVGDWPERDLDGAKNVGMKTAFARYGASSINENQYKVADIALNDISEILSYVEKQNSK